jgi:hypothetical protein
MLEGAIATLGIMGTGRVLPKWGGFEETLHFPPPNATGVFS